MIQLWGGLTILIVCPILGAFPIINWVTYALTGKKISQIGTRNISVSAAFYHGGQWVGLLAVLSEAVKGIGAVFLSRIFFPQGSYWELIALIALVSGRYWVGRGAGTTNVVWGFIVHDPLVTLFTSILTLISFTVLKSRQLIKFGVLLLLPLLVAILDVENFPKIVATAALSGLLAWIYTQIPDDLNLPVGNAAPGGQTTLTYLTDLKQAHRVLSLDEPLDANLVGAKAATLSQLKRWGYSVPKGWAIAPGDSPEKIVSILTPSHLSPLVVRSSAIGEDSEQASAAGQYTTILGVTSPEGLQAAITEVRDSYYYPSAVQYRRDRNLPDTAMGVLVQQQIPSFYSGVAFSRDPITQQGDAVVIEALPGSPSQVVSGKVTPEQYRVFIGASENIATAEVEGNGQVPQMLIKQVAYLSRQLEKHYHGVPQDVEWSYDNQTLWVLQSRPITTLLPIWTRKIAAEVIPGVIHPLTWSINRPLTCGVWGDIFTMVLGDRSLGLDFTSTATLHYSRAYFNVSLLGEIFLRMGLPPESLEFLTRGAKMSKPPLKSTLANLPGLIRLLKRELTLEKDFIRDYHQVFIPGLSQVAHESIENLQSSKLLSTIDLILDLLSKVTYYSIFVPISVTIRQGIFKVKDKEIDYTGTPEVSALRSLNALARQAREVLPNCHRDKVFEELPKTLEGSKIINEFQEILENYGYLSDVGTDIAVPTWKEHPQVIQELFIQLWQNTPAPDNVHRLKSRRSIVQSRVDIKGRVTELYSQLLAELRWRFIALEKIWVKSGLLKDTGDIFFLEIEEVRHLVTDDVNITPNLSEMIESRRSQFRQDSEIKQVPFVVYGQKAPQVITPPPLESEHILKGIPASHGEATGVVRVVRNLQDVRAVDKQTILVVPYTDSGWAPLLVRAGALIAEAGGRLSHGAIVAREYGIPAIMGVNGATFSLQDGQQVRVDGSRGIVEVIQLE